MKRIYSFDYFKLFAILGGVDLTPIGSIIESMTRFAVPFFFITAGFMFFIKADEKGLKKRYISYIRRMVILYLVWSIIYFFNNSYGAITWYGNTFEGYFWETVHIGDILYYGKKISEPLWFMPSLIISVSLVALAKRFNFLKALTIAGLVLNIVGLFGEAQMYNFIVKFPLFTRDALFYGLFYTSLGAFMAENKRYEKVGKSNRFWFAITALSFTLVAIEKHVLGSLSNWAVVAGDFYIFTIPLTFSLFIACIKSPNIGKGSIITKLGQGSLGIYLIHMLVQNWSAFIYYPLVGEGYWIKTPYRLTIGLYMFVVSWVVYYGIPGLFKKLVKPKNKEPKKEKISA